MHLLHGCKRASFLLPAFLPVLGIAFLRMMPDSAALFIHKPAYGMMVTIAVLLSGGLGLAASRSYQMELDVSLRYFTLAFAGFAFLFAFQALLLPVAAEEPMLFLAMGSLARLAICLYSYAGLRSLLAKRSPEFRKKPLIWWHRHFAAWAVIILLTAAVAEAGFLHAYVLKIVESLALGAALAASIQPLLMRNPAPPLRLQLLAQLILAQASLAFILAAPWNALWWFAHAVSTAGFLTLGYALLHSYEETRSTGRVFNENLLYPALRSIMRTTHEGFVMTDTLGKINYANPRMEALFQEKPAPGQLMSAYLARLNLKTASHEPLTAIVGNLLSGAAASIDLHLEALRDGTEPVYYECYASPVLDELSQTPMGYLFVFRNRSEEERLNRMKDDFVSIVSHELRTPMSAIQGFTEILLEREVPPEKRIRYLETVHDEIVRLSGLVDDFLDIQRMETGRLAYHFEPLDVGPLVAEVARQWQETDKHTLRLDLPAHGLFIRGDRERIIQLLHNLISNAVKYSPGAEAVDISLTCAEGRAAIRVKDYGLGIPEESLPRLFQKFYRVETARHRKIRGTGLGLSIVREIADTHGGEIRVESAPGSGSEFSVFLPAYEPPELKGRIALLQEPDEKNPLLLAAAAERAGEPLRFVSREELRFVLQHARSLPKLWIADIRLEEQRDGWSLLRMLLEDKQYRTNPLFIAVPGAAPACAPDQPSPDRQGLMDRMARELLRRPLEGQLLAAAYDEETLLQLLHRQGLEIAAIERMGGISTFMILSRPRDSEEPAS
ncbi:cell wall metabolism sensor histidine kinase WalK [Paenibacillus sp. YN15]|uniref:sensor histidine kinase n=1 Tax=Paenibacillus sp. YN15 TaxID=1742774 RepID=UPI0015EC2763|nr:ATP-binding protein [Paenibacillus sp. YN15]